MELSKDIVDRLEKLEKKYQAMGQDLVSYLDGLLHADYLTYWDYIHIDTLLSLQTPKTNQPDEQVFIIYHQITELYFKLCLIEMEIIAYDKKLSCNEFIKYLTRINRYFQNLTKSFDIMVDGMDPDQFLKFRMSLLPASGFQSAQYRMIEIRATDFYNLIDKEVIETISEDATTEQMYQNLYWKKGATELASGQQTLTLKQFEKKYEKEFIEMAEEYKDRNIWACYKSLPEKEQKNEELIELLRKFDQNVNVNWPLVHYKSAVRYLQKDTADIAATGGTNWQKYLPPRFQKRIFYKELWGKEEIEDWGRGFVEKEFLDVK